MYSHFIQFRSHCFIQFLQIKIKTGFKCNNLTNIKTNKLSTYLSQYNTQHSTEYRGYLDTEPAWMQLTSGTFSRNFVLALLFH